LKRTVGAEGGRTAVVEADLADAAMVESLIEIARGHEAAYSPRQ
jgi:hypothetical protein